MKSSKSLLLQIMRNNTLLSRIQCEVEQEQCTRAISLTRPSSDCVSSWNSSFLLMLSVNSIYHFNLEGNMMKKKKKKKREDGEEREEDDEY